LTRQLAIYQPINNGVYRAGFATTQSVYEGTEPIAFITGNATYACAEIALKQTVCSQRFFGLIQYIPSMQLAPRFDYP